MAIRVGRADAVVLSTDTATTNIDVNVGFTPTAGAYLCIVYWSGATSSTDATGSGDISMGIGFGVSSTSRGGASGFSQDNQTSSVASKSIFDDAILKATDGTDAVVGALDFSGEITNGVRFTVDDQFPATIRFGVVVIDGLSDVGIFNILSPAATGNANHTGAGVDNADLFLFIQSGPTTTIPSASSALQFGFGAAHADGQWSVNVVTRDNQANMDTYNYGLDLECIAMQNVAGAPIARASFVAAITDGLTLNWLEAGATNAITICAALKGIEATVQNGLTQTDTTTDIVITGLAEPCIGGLVVSNCEAESTQNAGSTHHHFSFGSFTGTASRNAHGTWDEDATANSECATSVEYDAVYTNIDSTDAVQGLMDIKSLDSGGATFIMDDADPAQKWFGAILFGAAATGRTALNTRSNPLGMEIGMGWRMPI